MKFISLLLLFMTVFTATQSVTVLPAEEAVIAETTLTDAGSALTEHLISNVMTDDWLTPGYEYTDLDVFRFLSSLCLYRDNEAHPYNDTVYMTADEQYFSTSYDDAKEMAYELFGNDSFITSEYAEEMFDSVSQSYNTPNGIGLWTSRYSYEGMTAREDDENVYVAFTLTNSKLYEYEEMNYGQYEFVFSKNSNHEYIYLTLTKLQKCE